MKTTQEVAMGLGDGCGGEAVNAATAYVGSTVNTALCHLLPHIPAALDWNSCCPKINVIGGLRVQEKYTNATLDLRDNLWPYSSTYQQRSVYFSTTQILTVGKLDSSLVNLSRKGEVLTRHLHDNRHWKVEKKETDPVVFSGFYA